MVVVKSSCNGFDTFLAWSGLDLSFGGLKKTRKETVETLSFSEGNVKF